MNRDCLKSDLLLSILFNIVFHLISKNYYVNLALINSKFKYLRITFSLLFRGLGREATWPRGPCV